MRTIQFTVSDYEYDIIKRASGEVGLGGAYAASTLSRMLVMQATGATVKGIRQSFLVDFSTSEVNVLEEYVRIKKGFAGPNPIATFIHKAAFDIINKYPPKAGK